MTDTETIVHLVVPVNLGVGFDGTDEEAFEEARRIIDEYIDGVDISDISATHMERHEV